VTHILTVNSEQEMLNSQMSTSFKRWVCTFIFYSFGYAKLRSNK